MSTLSLDSFSAAVFDLDGTLLDTLLDISESANRTLQQHGYPEHPIESFCYFVGDGPDVLFQRALKASSTDDPRIAPLVDTYRIEAAAQADRHTHLYSGMAELLDTLTSRNTSINILTNKHQPHAEICVERFMHRWSWQHVLGSGGSIPKKPDPKGALQITAMLNVSPEDCLYFGDTDVDMWTAKRAGMVAVGVLWGFRERKELEDAGADYIIEHPSEL